MTRLRLFSDVLASQKAKVIALAGLLVGPAIIGIAVRSPALRNTVDARGEAHLVRTIVTQDTMPDFIRISASVTYDAVVPENRTFIIDVGVTTIPQNVDQLYRAGARIAATLDLQGMDHATEPRYVSGGRVAWSVRPTEVGNFDGVIRFDVVIPAQPDSPAQVPYRRIIAAEPIVRVRVTEAPITARDFAKGALFVLGSFATLPGLWLLYREIKEFTAREKGLRDEEQRRVREQGQSIIVTPEAYARELERDRRRKRDGAEKIPPTEDGGPPRKAP